MDADAASSCHSCGAAISKDELAQGLAVRLGGNLVCPLCVDGLPGEAQVRINRVRAMRGLDAVTYRVPSPLHPQLARYTFTTAGNLVVHRHELADTGRFDAPLLPASRPAPAPAPGPAAGAAGPGRGRWMAAGAVVAALALGGGALALRGDPPPAVEGPPAATPAVEAAERPAKRRIDYASGALRAWEEAATDPDCPAEVREAIAGEIIAGRTRALDEAERALTEGDRERAAMLLAEDDLPQHVLFTGLRQRAAGLTRRAMEPAPGPVPVAAAPEPAPEPPPAAPPAPPAVAPPVVERPAPPAAPPADGPPAATGSSDRLLIPIADLAELPDRHDWSARRGGRALRADTGALARTLALAGGRYQAWVRAHGGETAGSVQLVLGATRTPPVALPPARTAAWHRVVAEVELPAGPCTLQVVALGRGASVADVYLAGAGLPGPERAEADALAPTWLPDPPPPAEPVEPVARSGPWSPRFADAHPTLDPLHPGSRVPAGLPGNAGPIHESIARARRKHGFALDLAAVDTAGGGLALLVHPMRPDRTRLAITLVDADNRRHQLPPSTIDPGRWNTLLVPTAAAAGQVDADRLRSVLIEDVDALTTSFLLAKVAVARGEAPSEAALELRPPALLPIGYGELDRALAAVALKRRSRNWRRDLDPARLKVLIGHQLLMGEWDTMARKGLAEVLREPLRNEELPGRTLQEFVMQDAWLDALFDPPPDKPAVLDPEKHHLVVLCTAGIEFPVGLTEPQAFLNLWTRLIDKCIERGVLPVTVLGPNKVDAADVAEVELLWTHVEGWLRRNRPGLPIIDLRPAKAISYQRFAPGMAQLSVRLLVDGYGELYRRILALKQLK